MSQSAGVIASATAALPSGPSSRRTAPTAAAAPAATSATKSASPTRPVPARNCSGTLCGCVTVEAVSR